MTDPVSVLIVDDQLPFRLAARAVVRATPGFVVVGEATSGEEALDRLEAIAPEIVLMDINMGGIDGIETTRRVVAVAPKTKVILLSTYDADDVAGDVAGCGASAYVKKEDFGPEVLERVWVDSEVTRPVSDR
jgi:DNA-binding NarL/FixJ family response regulator